MPEHVKNLSVQLRPGIVVVNGEIKRMLAPLSEGYDQTPPAS